MADKTPARIVWAIEQLAIDPADELLEIGCGTGIAVDLACTQLTRGHITAIDRSAAMIAAAQKRNAAHVHAGRAFLRTMALAEIESPPEHFDKAFAINVNVFWRNPAAELRAVRRVLKPRGDLYLVFQPPNQAKLGPMATACSRQLEQHGFSGIQTTRRPLQPVAALCVHAKRTAT